MPKPICARCGGSGWRILERDGLSAAERCDCVPLQPAEQDQAEKAQIPPLYKHASLDNFSLPKDNPMAERDLGRVVLTVRSFVREFPLGPKPGLLLIGGTGSGKTHLAVAALRQIMLRGFEGLFFDYSHLLDSIRSSYDTSSGSYDRDAFRSAMESEVLLLDDLGSQRVTDWVLDTMTSIFTYRCNYKKPLIATTNLPDPDAGDVLNQRTPGNVNNTDYRISLGERIGERARSRLFEMCEVVRMPSVGDYRLRKK